MNSWNWSHQLILLSLLQQQLVSLFSVVSVVCPWYLVFVQFKRSKLSEALAFSLETKRGITKRLRQHHEVSVLCVVNNQRTFFSVLQSRASQTLCACESLGGLVQKQSVQWVWAGAQESAFLTSGWSCCCWWSLDHAWGSQAFQLIVRCFNSDLRSVMVCLSLASSLVGSRVFRNSLSECIHSFIIR